MEYEEALNLINKVNIEIKKIKRKVLWLQIATGLLAGGMLLILCIYN